MHKPKNTLFGIVACALLLSACNDYRKVHYPDGSLEIKTEMKNGEPHGVTEGYYPSGELKLRGTYKNGNLEGDLVRYYKSGVVASKEYYVQGILEGSVIQYDSLKNTIAKVQYLNGKQHGLSVFYYPNGNVESEQEFNDGFQHGRYISYHESGLLSMNAFIENDTTVYYEQFDSLGNRIDEYWSVIVDGPQEVELGDNYEAVIRLPGPKDGFEPTVKYYGKNVIDEADELIVADDPRFSDEGVITGLRLWLYWKSMNGRPSREKKIDGTEIKVNADKQGVFEYTPTEAGPYLFKGVYFLEGKGGPNNDIPLVKAYKFDIRFNVKATSS